MDHQILTVVAVIGTVASVTQCILALVGFARSNSMLVLAMAVLTVVAVGALLFATYFYGKPLRNLAEIVDAVKALTRKIREGKHGPFDAVVAVNRNGAIAAGMLGQALHIRRVAVFDREAKGISSEGHRIYEYAQCVSMREEQWSRFKKILLVLLVEDTSITLQEATAYLRSQKFTGEIVMASACVSNSGYARMPSLIYGIKERDSLTRLEMLPWIDGPYDHS